MNLKNYTSTVPTERTIARIETLLAEAGAIDISKNYNDGRLKAICFSIQAVPEGRLVVIRLPANTEAVFDALKKEVKRPRDGTLEKLRIQAERTAWKLMQDWVEVQLSLIRLRQAELLQVFLPYVWDGERSFYTMLKEKRFTGFLLPAKTE